MVSESIFVPFARRMGAPGALVERVSYGCFHVVWEVRSCPQTSDLSLILLKKYTFKLFIAKVRSREGSLRSKANNVLKYLQGLSTYIYQFLVQEGTSEQPSKELLIAAGGWSQALHDEIWVFNQGFWNKNPGLWQEVQKANWKDVILNEDFKATLQKDIFGFFSSERVYLELQIPWKVFALYEYAYVNLMFSFSERRGFLRSSR